MKKSIGMIGLCLISSFALSACQMFPKDTMTGQTNLVMTSGVSKMTGHKKIVDTFTYGDKVSAYLTFYSDETDVVKKFKVKWYNDNKLVSEKVFVANVKRMPHFLWFSINSTELGSGKSRVDIYVEGKLLKSADFIVNSSAN